MRLLMAVLALVLFAGPAAHAEKRVALLVGNQSYGADVGPLKNPHNDVALLEDALKGLGFEITVVRDAGLGALTRAVNAYTRRLQAAGPGAIGFFYYSGHGASDGGTNYLIPTDVKTTEAGALWDESLRLTEITRKLKAEAGNATHFVVFDACRNTLKLTQPGSRAVVQSKGFVPVAQENGMLIAYATAEGELASDVGTGAGPYARVLAEEIVKPGIEAVVMFRAVQRRVRAAIAQEPYLGFNALGDVFLAGLSVSATSTGSSASPSAGEAERAWAAVKDTTSQAVLEDFIRRYGGSLYSTLARARLEELKKSQVAVVAPPVTPASPCGRSVSVSLSRSPRPLSANEECALKPRDVFKECDKCPEMVIVPAGSFMMGSLENEEFHQTDQSPQHLVTFSQPFAVGRFTITFSEWDACVADAGCNHHRPEDRGWGRGRRPVINVNWNDAKSYVAWLSRRTGKPYRLLSEAEREYVTRAGTTTPFWWGSSISPSQANYGANQSTVTVDSFQPNPWGLYQVHGNVYDWLEDCYHETYNGAPSDGSAWTSGDCKYRVLRGGSGGSDSRYLAAVQRARNVPDDRFVSTAGFRIGRTLSP